MMKVNDLIKFLLMQFIYNIRQTIGEVMYFVDVRIIADYITIIFFCKIMNHCIRNLFLKTSDNR